MVKQYASGKLYVCNTFYIEKGLPVKEARLKILYGEEGGPLIDPLTLVGYSNSTENPAVKQYYKLVSPLNEYLEITLPKYCMSDSIRRLEKFINSAIGKRNK